MSVDHQHPTLTGSSSPLSVSTARTASDRRLRIGFVHRADPRNIRSWSGIFYFMCKSLEQHVGEVVYLGPDHSKMTKLLFGALWRVNKVARYFRNTTLIGEANRLTAFRLASFFERRVREADVDVIFAPVAATETAYLRVDKPIVYLSDITWSKLVDYYPEYCSVSWLGRREAERIEQQAISNATMLVYPSNWAATSARDDYRASPQRIFTVPFGANLSEIPTRDSSIQHRLAEPIRLLWIGVDWRRKGADIAVACLNDLIQSGVNARLTLCGCAPPDGFANSYTDSVGFLNKHDSENAAKLSKLFQDSHFFIFPTRAEAFGVVVAEASAYGIPSLVTDTGGTRGVLQDGRNGYLLPPDATGKAYADKVRTVLSTPGRYEELVKTSREVFESTLNWCTWGEAMQVVFQNAMQMSRTPRSPRPLQDTRPRAEVIGPSVVDHRQEAGEIRAF